MRLFHRLLVVLVAPATLAAQDGVPDDWTYRLDADQAFAAGDTVRTGEWRYTRMPPGWHITTTAHGVSMYPKARHVMEGAWGIETEFFLFPDPSDQGAGIALLPTTDAEHRGELRLLLRRDGQVSAEVSDGGAIRVLAPWTQDTAADAHDGKEVKPYVLRVMHEGDQMTVAVNGRVMLTLPIGPNTAEPVAGFRAGAGLNLHVSRYDLITPLAPARQR